MVTWTGKCVACVLCSVAAFGSRGAVAERVVMFLENPRLADDAQTRELPTIWELVTLGETSGWVWGGGPPATRIIIGLRWQFNDQCRYGVVIEDFDFVQYEAESSWDLLGYDLTAGTPENFRAMFEAYGPRHPGVWIMYAWIGGGGVNGAALTDLVTTTDVLPRTLYAIDTLGDYVPFYAVLTGIPDMGDGVIGWSITGSVVAENMPIMADFDRSGRVDLRDFAAFQSCFTGQAPTDVSPCCRIFDFDLDKDVDVRDVALLASLITGP